MNQKEILTEGKKTQLSQGLQPGTIGTLFLLTLDELHFDVVNFGGQRPAGNAPGEE